ncbi:MAG: hypothetical protein V8S30_03625 [Merdibacter sp.]
MKKLLKAGIVGAIACSMIGGTVTPVAANETSASQNNEVTKTADEVMPLFMYTRVETVKGWEFDAVVTYDTQETQQTSSKWRIVGLQDVDLFQKVVMLLHITIPMNTMIIFRG